MIIHFICRGNALRSSLAQAYFNSLQIPDMRATSSGTCADVHREENRQRIASVFTLLTQQGIGEYAKSAPEQLTPERIGSPDLVVCMNQLVAYEARQIVDLPSNTQVWNVDDIGEGSRIPQTDRDEARMLIEVFKEIKQNVNELAVKLNNILTPQEIGTITHLLNRLEPGMLPEPIFIALSRLVVMVAVEFCVLRKTDGRVEILLTQRPEDDPIWPSKWHSPGTIIRPTDKTLESCYHRLYKDELGGMVPLMPRPLGMVYGSGERGKGISLEYVLDATDTKIPVGAFFSLDNLPPNYIEEQLPMWRRAISSFL